jgi:hypothetical protein
LADDACGKRREELPSWRFDRLRELLLIHEMEVDMKFAVLGALSCIAMVPIASAEAGGYPASPSHAIVGTNPDGTPRYGSEPGRSSDTSRSTVGRGGSNPSENVSERGKDIAKDRAGQVGPR